MYNHTTRFSLGSVLRLVVVITIVAAVSLYIPRFVERVYTSGAGITYSKPYRFTYAQHLDNATVLVMANGEMIRTPPLTHTPERYTWVVIEYRFGIAQRVIHPNDARKR